MGCSTKLTRPPLAPHEKQQKTCSKKEKDVLFEPSWIGHGIRSRSVDIPADARIIELVHLHVDESALTGESIPVSKIDEIVKNDKVIVGEQRNMLFMSTIVTQGRAKAIVTGTGMSTEIGKIAELIQKAEMLYGFQKLKQISEGSQSLTL